MSNLQRQFFVPAAFAGVVIWSAAAVHPAVADESATYWSAPAARGGQASDCAIASRGFDFRPQPRAAATEQVHAPGGARLHSLLAAPCGRGAIVRDV